MIVLEEGEKLRRRYPAKLVTEKIGDGTLYYTDRRICFESNRHGLCLDVPFDSLYYWGRDRHHVYIKWIEKPKNEKNEQIFTVKIQIPNKKPNGDTLTTFDVAVSLYYSYLLHYRFGDNWRKQAMRTDIEHYAKTNTKKEFHLSDTFYNIKWDDLEKKGKPHTERVRIKYRGEEEMKLRHTLRISRRLEQWDVNLPYKSWRFSAGLLRNIGSDANRDRISKAPYLPENWKETLVGLDIIDDYYTRTAWCDDLICEFYDGEVWTFGEDKLAQMKIKEKLKEFMESRMHADDYPHKSLYENNDSRAHKDSITGIWPLDGCSPFIPKAPTCEIYVHGMEKRHKYNTRISSLLYNESKNGRLRSLHHAYATHKKLFRLMCANFDSDDVDIPTWEPVFITKSQIERSRELVSRFSDGVTETA